MNKFIFLTGAILLNYSAFAVDLDEALTNAYTKNNDLQVIRNNFLNEIERFPQAFSEFMPRVNYNINYQDSKNKPESKLVSRIPIHTKSKQGTFTIDQPIFNGGSSVAGMKSAQSAFRASRAKYYAEEQRVLLNLIKSYLDCYEAQEKYNISEISLKTNRQQLDTTEEKLKLGEATLIDLATAKSGLTTAETNKLTAYADYQAKKANFVRVFGIEAQDIGMPGLPDNIPNSREIFLQRAVNVNPNIDSLRHAMKSQKATELATKAQLLPTVSLRLQTGKSYYKPESPITQQFNTRSTTTTLSVNIPIYGQGGVEYSKIRTAKNNTRNAAIQLDDAVRQVQAGVISSWEGFEAAKSKIIATTQAVEAAQISYEGTMQEEIVGSKTMLDVLTAEEKLYNARIAKVDAHRDAILAAYQIKSFIGELTARSLKLKVKYFTPEDEFKRLKTKLVIGT
ncbi:MAG: TolC family outer membrane protein [Rickettsia endosymbiont of Bryobia graminum]|nr:TolC family outer membrane protein [Rickettsia endosymbiont of Bryobia graminum]